MCIKFLVNLHQVSKKCAINIWKICNNFLGNLQKIFMKWVRNFVENEKGFSLKCARNLSAECLEFGRCRKISGNREKNFWGNVQENSAKIKGNFLEKEKKFLVKNKMNFWKFENIFRGFHRKFLAKIKEVSGKITGICRTSAWNSMKACIKLLRNTRDVPKISPAENFTSFWKLYKKFRGNFKKKFFLRNSQEIFKKLTRNFWWIY